MAKKKNQITYDSKETATFIGLLSFIAAVFFVISVFSVAPDNESLFVQAKGIFNNATIFLSIFLFSLALKLFGVRLPIFKIIPQLAQIILVVLIAGFLTASSSQDPLVSLANPAGTDGGQIGWYIVRNIFQDATQASFFTQFILLLIILVLIPIALAIPYKFIIGIVVKILQPITNLIRNLFFYNHDEDEEESDDHESEVVSKKVPKAERIGDFNDLIRKKKPISEIKQKNDDDDDEKEEETVYVKDIATKKQKTSKESSGDVKFSEEKKEDGLLQDQLQYPKWKLPPVSLLIPFSKSNAKEPSIKQNAEIIEQILESFKIEAKVEESYIGPSVVMYALSIPLGINVKKIATLSENIALALGVDSKAVRIDSIPETTYLGIEVPRFQRDMVRIKEIMSSGEMGGTKATLPVPIGKDINGDQIVGDIQKMPHLLIAGATGSGKSVLTNGFITSLIMKKSPDELKLILVDPKQVEFIDYNGIPHLLHPVITDMELVVKALKWSVAEMEKRYSILAANQTRNIEGYNSKMGFAAMPYIVIVIDEMADMMMTSNKIEAENAIVRLAQKARAVGIHLILATQRPSVNVITGIIKANIPGRVAMSVTSSTDSRVILDRIGAESLMGKGDLLYKAPDKTKSIRLQCANIEQEEVTRIVDFIKSQAPEFEYPLNFSEITLEGDKGDNGVLENVSEDSMVEQAIRIVVQSGKGSSSYLQRRLGIGFNRAAKLLEELEEAGVVGPANGSKPREVLIGDADEFIRQLKG